MFSAIAAKRQIREKEASGSQPKKACKAKDVSAPPDHDSTDSDAYEVEDVLAGLHDDDAFQMDEIDDRYQHNADNVSDSESSESRGRESESDAEPVAQELELDGNLIAHHNPEGPDDISKTPSEGPTQPKINFPVKQQDYKRSFQASWYKKFPWLEYSERIDAAFCFACRHFLLPSANAEKTFTAGGFCNWKKARGKTGKLEKHANADYHVDAMVKWSSFKSSTKVSVI